MPSREGFPRHKNKCIDMLDEAIEMLVLLTKKNNSQETNAEDKKQMMVAIMTTRGMKEMRW